MIDSYEYYFNHNLAIMPQLYGQVEQWRKKCGYSTILVLKPELHNIAPQYN